MEATQRLLREQSNFGRIPEAMMIADPHPAVLRGRTERIL